MAFEDSMRKGYTLADPDDPDQGVLSGLVPERMAGSVFDNAVGMSGEGGGGIVGMSGSYPSSEMEGIIAQAIENIQGATGNLEGKAAGYRADADELRRTLGVIPASETM